MSSDTKPTTSDIKQTKNSTAAKPRRRFVGSKAGPPSKLSGAPVAHQIPEGILHDAGLNKAIVQLPANYSFEIHKTVHHIRKHGARMVALQMPEGLQMFACTIADIIERCAGDMPSWTRSSRFLTHTCLRMKVHGSTDGYPGRRHIWRVLC